jgi:tRNA-binding protein
VERAAEAPGTFARRRHRVYVRSSPAGAAPAGTRAAEGAGPAPGGDLVGDATKTITPEEFERVEIRVGTILEAEPFPEARKPLYRLRIDFGPEIGVRRSAAGLPVRYAAEDLPGRQVIACLNLGVRTIAGFRSECLTLGVPDAGGAPILLAPTDAVPDGGRLY